MSDLLRSATAAIVLGGAVCIVLFVPFVALSYRRRGTVTVGRAVLWGTAAVYAWAIWAFTLLPLPDQGDVRCVGVNLNPLLFLDDIGEHAPDAADLLHNVAIRQLALNVVLFVPFGVFVRLLTGRGVVVAAVVGFLLSLSVELTQLTGLWGVYDCAFRIFDVVDLETNTLGAILGSLLALAFPARLQDRAVPGADRPGPVTRGRRLLAMACDALAFVLLSNGATIVLRFALDVVGAERTSEGPWPDRLGLLVALAVWAATVLLTGRSIGDLAVRLRFTGGPLPDPLVRVLRLVSGVAGWAVLGLVPDVGEFLQIAFVVIHLGLVAAFPDGRGLVGLVTGTQPADSR